MAVVFGIGYFFTLENLGNGGQKADHLVFFRPRINRGSPDDLVPKDYQT